MVMKRKPKIYIIDDDADVRYAICEILNRAGYDAAGFDRATHFFNTKKTENCELLITDLKMPDMDGFEVLKRVKQQAPWLPVLVITGFGDVPLAVRAMKFGAADFIEKPLVKDTFLRKVDAVLNTLPPQGLDDVQLTKMEKKIFTYIIEGKTNKQIAYQLNRSVRTVEMHRHNIMKKFDVHNVVDLVKKASLFKKQ